MICKVPWSNPNHAVIYLPSMALAGKGMLPVVPCGWWPSSCVGEHMDCRGIFSDTAKGFGLKNHHGTGKFELCGCV